MLYNTDAIVIRTLNYGETHAIVNLLTPSGLVAAMARGAKKPQSRLAASVQLCAQGVYSIYQKSGMGNIQQVELTDSRRALREDLLLAAYAAYFCEITAAIAPERPHGSEAFYRSFTGVLDRLNLRPEEADTTSMLWEAKVLEWLGASPKWNQCVRCHSTELLVAYSPVDGGMVCHNCLPRHANQFLVTPQNLPRVLENLRTIPVDRVGSIRLTDEVKELGRKILRMQMSEYGGLHLKSQGFLESLESGNLLDGLMDSE